MPNHFEEQWTKINHQKTNMNKLKKLKKILTEMDSILVAYSGGVDSTLLLKIAKDLSLSKILAVTAVSETYPAQEIDEAKKMAKKLKVKHILINTAELTNGNFIINNPQRCYFCKQELFAKLKKIAEENKVKTIIDGTNKDDFNDFRPGLKAAEEYKIRHPLQEAGLTKQEIRQLSKSFHLPTWNKPALACLSSRIPYGTKINKKVLAKIEKGERYLKKLGLRQIRVRDYGTLARIEVDKNDFSKIINCREKINRKFEKLGYIYVTLDLAGYRTGSMNEIFKIRKIPNKKNEEISEDDE